MPTATDAEVLDLLTSGEMSVLGRIVDSSNSALLVQVSGPEREVLAVYKPVALERRLWDYPDGTHAGREHAAYVVDRLGGFDLVPPTVLRDGPHGPGSVQQWVGGLEERAEILVDVVAEDATPPGWLVVLRGQDEAGRDVAVVHPDRPELRTMAVLDAVLNNSDRKGGHVLADGARVRGIDHGVSLGVEPKLRTVLWAWAGEEIPEADLARLQALARGLEEVPDALAAVLTGDEVDALRERVAVLLATRTHPRPSAHWPSIPWPAL